MTNWRAGMKAVCVHSGRLGRLVVGGIYVIDDTFICPHGNSAVHVALPFDGYRCIFSNTCGCLLPERKEWFYPDRFRPLLDADNEAALDVIEQEGQFVEA